jgi:hypothetical protein
MSARKAPRQKPVDHADGGTTRPETPELEGRVPLPEEITGRASGTDDDLVSLFKNQSTDHIADGFRGGSGDIPGGGIVDTSPPEAWKPRQ